MPAEGAVRRQGGFGERVHRQPPGDRAAADAGGAQLRSANERGTSRPDEELDRERRGGWHLFARGFNAHYLGVVFIGLLALAGAFLARKAAPERS